MVVAAAEPDVVAVMAVGGVSTSAAQPVGERVTFTEHVAPILFESCTTWHCPGQGGRMSLLTYEEMMFTALACPIDESDDTTTMQQQP